MSLFSDLGAGYLAYEGLEKVKEAAKELPQQMLQGVETVGGMTEPYTQFKPFTVTTATGTAGATRDPVTGALGVSFTPEQQQLILKPYANKCCPSLHKHRMSRICR